MAFWMPSNTNGCDGEHMSGQYQFLEVMPSFRRNKNKQRERERERKYPRVDYEQT